MALPQRGAAFPGRLAADRCHLCENRLASVLPTVIDPITGQRFAVYRCIGCGLGHTLPRPTDAAPFYGPGYYGKRHGVTAAFCTRRRLRLTRAAAGPLRGKKLLDIGCGDGAFLERARGADAAVFGVDIHPEPARAAGFEVAARITDFSGQAPFDVVTMWHSLEHMQDLHDTIGQVSGLLGKTGVVLIAVPDGGGYQASVFGPSWIHLDVPRHLYHFDAPALRFGLQKAGLTVFRTWHQELEYDLLGWSQSALNRLFPTPNVFFNMLTGKTAGEHAVRIILHGFLGALFTGLALPAVAFARLARRGSTLIVAASKTNAPRDSGIRSAESGDRAIGG